MARIQAEHLTCGEPVIEPDLPIVDPHHHLWSSHPISRLADISPHPFDEIFARDPVYLEEQLLSDLGSGHNVVATVYVECGAFYRTQGSDDDRALGEIETIVEIGSRLQSEREGVRPCAAIVGFVDLAGDDAAAALDRAIEAGAGRLRGIRNIGPHDEDETVLGPIAAALPGLYGSDAFRRGISALGQAGLSFDAWVLAPQIAEVTELARAYPDVRIVLDHVGTPLGIGRYNGKRETDFPVWLQSIQELATCANVHVKLGGLAMPFPMLQGLGPKRRVGSEVLARLWKPYVESCIEAFGPKRCMFESNFPVDHWGADYRELWNAFKILTHGVSRDEKAWLFSMSAAEFYKLDLSEIGVRHKPGVNDA